MTGKHTAGEWVDRGTGCVGTTHQLIACVYPMKEENPEEHAANMRLIAAAPDLLEVLQELCEIVEDAIEQKSAKDLDSFTLQPARAAIAKATGGQP